VKIPKENILSNLINIIFSLPSSFLSTACWFMSKKFIFALSRETIKNKSKGLIFKSDNGIPSITLLGYPVFIEDSIEDSGFCIFGSFFHGYQYVVGREMNVLRDNISKKGMVQFFTTVRVGGDVVNSKAFIVCEMPESFEYIEKNAKGKFLEEEQE
jgi:HK97 family phage major capsid protein